MDEHACVDVWMCVLMDGWMFLCLYFVWMDGWMYACMHAILSIYVLVVAL